MDGPHPRHKDSRVDSIGFEKASSWEGNGERGCLEGAGESGGLAWSKKKKVYMYETLKESI